MTRLTVAAWACAMIIPARVCAAAPDTNQDVRGLLSALNLIVWVTCFAGRHREIGGWLLYFICQLFAGTTLAVVSAFYDTDLHRSSWNSGTQYALFLAIHLPALFIRLGESVVTIQLLRSYDWSWVRVLRLLLAADAAINTVAVVLYERVFHSEAVFPTANLLLALAWLLYFLKSRRVREVFFTRNWNTKNKTRPLQMSRQ